MHKEFPERSELLSMTPEQDQELCSQIRSFLIENVSQTGGHLASNLGVVELTLALHKVYDTAVDRVLFDVGHQAYAHKLLTGRMDAFPTLRKFGGIAGFPKPAESCHDAFVAGHASDSVSVALGMARARTLMKQDFQVAVVLGDGALTGGLAYEGLNDAGDSGEPLVVILNDNGMSITPNVGAISRHLAKARLRPGYLGIKKAYRSFTKTIPGGKYLYNFTHNLKTHIRRKLLGVTFFEDMGFAYLGPVDGHDVRKLTFLLKEARDMQVPVLLHVITKKGKGYSPAENTPAQYHGVGKFDPETGAVKQSGATSFSKTFGETLCSLARENPQICAITAAMEEGTGLKSFACQFPDRYYDVGIAEGHAVCMAAGLASQGMLPVFAVYSTFLQRSYDMLIHDISLMQLHVVLAVDRAGLVGEDGETHHGIFDVGYLRQVPGMQVLCPSNQKELDIMLRRAIYDMNGPVAVRYPRGGDGFFTEAAETPVIQDGEQLTVVTYGTTINDVMAASEMLQTRDHICVEIIKLAQIQPLDLRDIAVSVRKTGRLLVVEECAAAGSVGQEICSALTQMQLTPKVALLNLKSGIVPHGDVVSLRHMMGMDAEGIYQTAKELLKNEA